MALLLKTNGTTETIEPKDKAEGFSLEECYSLLGCQMIEIIALDESTIFIIDEEGKFKADPVPNRTATAMALDKHAIYQDDYIVGDAILCDTGELQ